MQMSRHSNHLPLRQGLNPRNWMRSLGREGHSDFIGFIKRLELAHLPCLPGDGLSQKSSLQGLGDA